MSNYQANKCVHFNGIQNERCKKGIAYNTFKSGLPCLKDYAKPETTCSSYLEPTETQIAESKAKREAAISRLQLVLEAIKPIRQTKKGQNWSGTITCPVCQGNLRLTHAACNGHMSAMCDTPDCVGFME